MLKEFGWKNGTGSSEQVRSRRKQKKRLSGVEVLTGREKGAQKQEIQNKKVVRRLLGKTFLFVQRIQLAASAMQTGELTEEEEMTQQQRMVIMKDLMRKIRSKGRMDAKN